MTGLRRVLFSRYTYHLLLAGWLLVVTNLVYAISLQQLEQRFRSQPIVRAHFSQQRHIKDFVQPLLSEGQMIIARDHGLLWQQTAPFPMLLLLNAEQMSQSISNQPAEIITLKNNPQLFQFNSLLRALFQADRQQLERQFRLDFQDHGDQRWQLTLTPISSPLDKIFTRIVLNGQTWLNQIDIYDGQGDHTTITLSEQRTTPDQLTDEEHQLFSH